MNLLAKLFHASRSIRQRLFWRLGVLSLGTLSIVNLIWLPSSIREIRQSQAELQRVAVRSVGEQIRLFLEERERELKSQAALLSGPFITNDQEAVRQLAHRFLQSDPAFEEIGLVDRQGKERFRLSRKLVITARELRDLSAAPFYQEGMRGKLFWGPVFTTETSEPWVTLAVPLRASETTMTGVVFGVLSLKSLWDLTGEFNLAYGGRAYVVEQTGRVIAAGDSSLVLRQFSFADRPLIQRLSQSADSAAYSFVQDDYVNEDKVSVTATGLLLPGPRWAMVVEQSQPLLYGPVRQKLWLSLGISLIGLLVCFGLARSLSSRLTGPIIRLREGVELIGHGQFEHRVAIEGADEVGELAAYFNAMAESLEEQEAQRRQAEERIQRQLERITALREFSVATTSTLDLDSVLKLLMEKIDALLPYTAALVWLLNRERGQLERAACWNLNEAEWKGRKLPGTPPLVKLAFEGKAPVVANNVQTDPRAGDGEFFRRHGLVSYLAVPLLVRDDVLGVLSFLTREGHEFTSEEIEFLCVLSGQAAVAIDNAQLFKKTQHNLERTRALQDIEQAITSTLDLHTVLDVLLEKIDFLLPYAAATVRLFNKESRLLEPVACRNLNREEWRAQPWRGGRGLANVVFEAQTPTVIRNTLTDMRVRDHEFYRRHRLISFLGIPLTVKEETLGVISFYTREEHEFSKEEIEFLGSVARQAAIAIYNSQLYEQTKRQSVELDKANKVKDEFLGFVSHELRTPVNAVIGYTGMVKEGILGEINRQQESTLGKVIKRSEELLDMINTLLEAARIEAGAAKTNREEFRLRGFLDELKSTYDVPSDKELTLVWDYPSDLPAVTTDREKLRHILQNLVNNAIKYTDKGDVTISARVRQQARGDRQQGTDQLTPEISVEFKVADTGMGIPKEFLPTIFEMFRQVDGSKAGRRSGVGLGLHIVKKFTELLGGKIEVDSEPGKGSTFTVTLPV